jgi:hypothetical protein
MSIEKFEGLPDVITYPRDAIVGRKHVAAALHVGERTVDGMHLPLFSASREPRYLWGQVLDVLAERALPTPTPSSSRRRGR